MNVLKSIIKYIYLSITSKILYPINFLGRQATMDDGSTFKVFRHLSVKRDNYNNNGSILIVRFKFTNFSHKTNIFLSMIPIPLIAGHSGFNDKLWMIDWKTGYWQGIYQWNSVDDIEKYKKTFIYNIMIKRAIKGSFCNKIISDISISNFLRLHKTDITYKPQFSREVLNVSV